jgi:hypothetical protein
MGMALSESDRTAKTTDRTATKRLQMRMIMTFG